MKPRKIIANGREFWFSTDEGHQGWYPDKIEVHALRFCEDNGLLTNFCYDLGAHHGLYTLLMASTGAEVVAFEPDRNNFSYLCENIKANSGALPKSAMVYANLSVVGDGSPVGFEGEKVVPGSALISKTLVGQCYPTQRPFIKMDVEGHEEAVLKGSGDLFHGKANFYIELHPQFVKDYSFLWTYIKRDAYKLTERGSEIFGLSITPAVNPDTSPALPLG